MKRQMIGFSIVVVFITGVFFTFSSCTDKEADQQPQPTEQQQQTKVEYYCPMECEGDKTYDKPGKCPKCGMDLEEKEIK